MVGHTSVRRLLLLGAVAVLENLDVDKRDRDLGIPPLELFPYVSQPSWLDISRTAISGNTAELSGAGIFVEDPRDLSIEWKVQADSFEKRVDCNNAAKPGFGKTKRLHSNTVARGYEENLASISDAFCVSVVEDEKPVRVISAGQKYRLTNWRSGDAFPTLKIVMYDRFGNAYSMTKPPRLNEGMRVTQPAKAYDAKLMAILAAIENEDSPKRLVLNDVYSDVSSGEAEIRLGNLQPQPGNYTLMLHVDGYPSWNVTIEVEVVGGPNQRKRG